MISGSSQRSKILLLLLLATAGAAYRQPQQPRRLKKQTSGGVRLPPTPGQQYQKQQKQHKEQLVGGSDKKKAAAWKTVAELAAVGTVVQCKVISVNRGGAICIVQGLKAFLPNSHLMVQPVADHNLRGQTLSVKIIEANAAAKQLVVSNREAIRENLTRGDVVHGLVTSLRSYGVIVTFGGVRGLLHKSNISTNDWKLIRNKKNNGYIVDEIFRDDSETKDVLLQLGSTVKCMVLDHNHYSQKISLSTETLEPNPGDMLRNPLRVFAQAERTAAAAAYDDEMLDQHLECILEEQSQSQKGSYKSLSCSLQEALHSVEEALR